MTKSKTESATELRETDLFIVGVNTEPTGPKRGEGRRLELILSPREPLDLTVEVVDAFRNPIDLTQLDVTWKINVFANNSANMVLTRNNGLVVVGNTVKVASEYRGYYRPRVGVGGANV